jgi:circadian clock protein KaiC
MLRDIEANGERTRGIYVRKSRGMSHSNQIREFLLTNRGIDLRDVYIGPAGVLTGSARLSQEAEERVQAERRNRELQRKRDILERKRKRLEERMDELRVRYQHEARAVQLAIDEAENAERARGENRRAMATLRWADEEANNERS